MLNLTSLANLKGIVSLTASEAYDIKGGSRRRRRRRGNTNNVGGTPTGGGGTPPPPITDPEGAGNE